MVFKIETYAEATMPVHDIEGARKICRGIPSNHSVPPMAMR